MTKHGSYKPRNNIEGMEVNRSNRNIRVGRYHNHFSIFDAGNIAVETDSGFKKVSIIKQVTRANGKRHWFADNHHSVNVLKYRG